jgi:hypothetical protein
MIVWEEENEINSGAAARPEEPYGAGRAGRSPRVSSRRSGFDALAGDVSVASGGFKWVDHGLGGETVVCRVEEVFKPR